jgi:hypothetical protein
MSEGSAITQEPGAVQPEATTSSKRRLLGKWWWIGGIVVAILVVIILAPLASADPDGLERVAENVGFIDQAENFVSGILGDYAIPGIDDPWISTVLSGLLGLAVVLGVVFLVGKLVARRKPA